jgi:hypothetical protein
LSNVWFFSFLPLNQLMLFSPLFFCLAFGPHYFILLFCFVLVPFIKFIFFQSHPLILKY